MGLLRVRHDVVTKQQQQQIIMRGYDKGDGSTVCALVLAKGCWYLWINKGLMNLIIRKRSDKYIVRAFCRTIILDSSKKSVSLVRMKKPGTLDYRILRRKTWLTVEILQV